MSRRFNGRQARRGRPRYVQRSTSMDRSILGDSPNMVEVEIMDGPNSEATLFDVFNWISSGMGPNDERSENSTTTTIRQPIARSQLTRLPSRTTMTLSAGTSDSNSANTPPIPTARSQQQTTLNSLIWLNDLLLDAVIDLKVELARANTLNQRQVDSLAGLRSDLANVVPQKLARELARALEKSNSTSSATKSKPIPTTTSSSAARTHPNLKLNRTTNVLRSNSLNDYTSEPDATGSPSSGSTTSISGAVNSNESPAAPR